MLSSILLSKKAKKYGRWIVSLFSRTLPHPFFSKYKFHFTCIIAHHLWSKNEENHGKISSWKLSESRVILNSRLAACNKRNIAIWTREKINLPLSQYTCVTHHSRVKHAEWRRKRLLKNRSTLGIHSHEKVDRLK